MESVASDFRDFCSIEEGGSSRVRRLSNDPRECNGTKEFKSKNLDAERKRRRRIGDRLLILRSLVPIITNMNKATIIDDAITYIEKMKNHVQELTDQLLEMESSSDEKKEEKPKLGELYSIEEITNNRIQEDVQVTCIDGERLWIKVVSVKKRGAFTKIIETMNFLGLEVTDTSFTTSKGAIVVTSCVEGRLSGARRPAVEEIRKLLLDIVRNI